MKSTTIMIIVDHSKLESTEYLTQCSLIYS